VGAVEQTHIEVHVLSTRLGEEPGGWSEEHAHSDQAEDRFVAVLIREKAPELGHRNVSDGMEQTEELNLSLVKFEGFEVILFSSSSTNSQMRKYDIYDSNHVEFDFKIAIYFSWAIKRTEKDQHIAAQAAALFGAQARKKNVDVIFISSLASLPIHSKSNYGNYKLEAEHSMKMSGHAVVRPGTITSKHDADISSSLTQMLRYVTLARIFTYLSRKILIPTVEIECFAHKILNLVKNPQPCDINLIQNIVSLEEFSSRPRVILA
jgi:hypothetical protein